MNMTMHLLAGVSFVVSRLSWKSLQRLGHALGFIWYHFFRIRRSTVHSNIQKVIPLSARERRAIAVQSYQHMCVNVLELCKQHFSRDSAMERVSVEGVSHFESCFRRGKGVIVVTGHMGNFDLLACDQAQRGIRLGIVSKSLHQSGVNRFWMNLRSQSGLVIFEEGKSAKRIVQWLQSGHVLGMVIDQRVSSKKGGREVPFFGYGVWTSTSAVKLALHTGAAILPVVIVRQAEGGHRIVIEPEIRFDDVCQVDDVQRMTAIHRRLEQWILNHPEQWMWLHRRFKNASKL